MKKQLVAIRTALIVLVALMATAGVHTLAQTSHPAEQAKSTGILHSAELEKLIPPSVYFQGQSATVQLRNSSGVRFPDGAVMFAAKVDTGGYSTSIQERYQDYLVTETPLLLGEGATARTLAPGAYGIGFTTADGLLVMDIGGHTLFSVTALTEPTLRRPSPLQILVQGSGFRLYSGRSYIPFSAVATGKATH